MFKTTLAVVVCFGSALAQNPNANPQYVAADAFTTSSSEALTVQIAAGSPKSVVGGTVSGSVSAAANICFTWNMSAATATSLAVSTLPGSPYGAATAWKASNASGGTSGGCFLLATGAFNFTWANVFLPKQSATVGNFTATITPATGSITGNINAQWSEQ